MLLPLVARISKRLDSESDCESDRSDDEAAGISLEQGGGAAGEGSEPTSKRPKKAAWLWEQMLPADQAGLAGPVAALRCAQPGHPKSTYQPGCFGCAGVLMLRSGERRAAVDGAGGPDALFPRLDGVGLFKVRAMHS